MGQPIIRGIQAVGAVDIKYTYNSADNKLFIPSQFQLGGNTGDDAVITALNLPLAGFRLDGEFLRAVQQIASSVVIPILGGGGVALTNNNRTGSLTLNCAKVSTPDTGAPYDGNASNKGGSMFQSGTDAGSFGPTVSDPRYFDAVFIAQLQQGQEGGDSVGANITVEFMFCGKKTSVTFESCTVATVDPLGMSGNDAAGYSVVWNYLNWRVHYDGPVTESKVPEAPEPTA